MNKNGNLLWVKEFLPKNTLLEYLKKYQQSNDYLYENLVGEQEYEEVSLLNNENIATPQIINYFDVKQLWIKQSKFTLYIFNKDKDFVVMLTGRYERLNKMVEENKPLINSIFNNYGCDM